MTSFDPQDVALNRVKGGLGYLLFFLPLILCPGSRYGKYCAGQGLWVLIAHVAVSLAFWVVGMVVGWIPLVGWVVDVVHWLCRAAVTLLALYYCYLACVKGDARPLPVVGQVQLIR